MQKLLYIGLAGLAGTLLRYGVSNWAARRYGETFPAGTLVVNLAGCFLAGFLFHLLHERFAAGEAFRAAVLIGLLGGSTTFSAYGLQTYLLLRGNEPGLALLNVVLANAAGLLLVWVGYAAAKLV